MTFNVIVVYFLGATAVLATAAMLFTMEPLRAALAMLVTLIATAGIYILLSAQLAAFIQVIVYAGAIMTLFIIALNTLPFQINKTEPERKIAPLQLAALAGAAILMAELLQIALTVKAGMSLAFIPEDINALSALLFGKYAFQFELLSLMILSAVVGAVAVAKRKL